MELGLYVLAWETLKKGGLDYSENYHPNIRYEELPNRMNDYSDCDNMSCKKESSIFSATEE